MASPCYLGIDFGTSGARACVIAGNEEIETLERIEFGPLQGFEQASAWRECLFDLIVKVPVSLRRRLAALAIDGTSGSIVACDEALLPSHEPLLYHDSRAQPAPLRRVRRHACARRRAEVSGAAEVLMVNRLLKIAVPHLRGASA